MYSDEDNVILYKMAYKYYYNYVCRFSSANAVLYTGLLRDGLFKFAVSLWL